MLILNLGATLRRCTAWLFAHWRESPLNLQRLLLSAAALPKGWSGHLNHGDAKFGIDSQEILASRFGGGSSLSGVSREVASSLDTPTLHLLVDARPRAGRRLE